MTNFTCQCEGFIVEVLDIISDMQSQCEWLVNGGRRFAVILESNFCSRFVRLDLFRK